MHTREKKSEFCSSTRHERTLNKDFSRHIIIHGDNKLTFEEMKLMPALY